VSFGNNVGSKIASVAGGVPVPEASVMMGPGSNAW
jgi:hypothetical protein